MLFTLNLLPTIPSVMPHSPISKLPIAEQLKVREPADIQRIYLWLGTSMMDMKPIKELIGRSNHCNFRCRSDVISRRSRPRVVCRTVW